MSLNQSTAGLRVLRHILGMDPKGASAAIAESKPFLTYEEEWKAFDFIKTHYTTHGKFPHPDTLLDQIAVFLPPLQEPYEFDLEQLKNRYVEDAMRAASDKASALIATGDAKGALSILLNDLLPVSQGHVAQTVFDLRETETSALAHYKAQLDGTAPPIKLIGYPTLDAQGGIEPGDMIGIIGRPSSGKTWKMLFSALTYWGAYQEPVLFVTQEMSAMQVEKRAVPITAGVDPTPLYKGTPIQYELHGHTPQTYMKALEDASAMLKGASAPFLIYDSKMAGTVADVESIATLHGVRKVWIDGAYMLSHPDRRLNRYQRVPENLDLMKKWCQRSGVSLFSSWQFKKGAGKNDAAGDSPDLDDIGYSHAIAEYMSIILGLLENPKSIGQMNKKRVDIMKGRNGEVGGYDMHWDFSTMNFKEITASESQSDLTYL